MTSVLSINLSGSLPGALAIASHLKPRGVTRITDPAWSEPASDVPEFLARPATYVAPDEYARQSEPAGDIPDPWAPSVADLSAIPPGPIRYGSSHF
jgi:hypothetical protein